MVGVVDYLDRPVMGLVRLLNSLLIGNLAIKHQLFVYFFLLFIKTHTHTHKEHINHKVRFLFVLLGPKNDNIDYLEIGRCMGTLMTNKVRDMIG